MSTNNNSIKSYIKSYDYLIKFVLIGDANCGKTSLIRRFCNNEFSTDYLTTIGVDFSFKTIAVENSNIKIQIWDTAGQEKFRSITQTYYRGSNVILLFFDLSDRKTFENIEYWYRSIIENTNEPNTQIYLIGNKSDLKEDIDITMKEINNVIKNTKMIGTFIISAKNDEGILDMFETISKKCIELHNYKKNNFISQKNENKLEKIKCRNI